MKRKIILVIAIILLAALAYGAYYVNDYYHADDRAQGYMNGTDDVSVIKTDKGLFLDGPGNDSALIFTLEQRWNTPHICRFCVKYPATEQTAF